MERVLNFFGSFIAVAFLICLGFSSKGQSATVKDKLNYLNAKIPLYYVFKDFKIKFNKDYDTKSSGELIISIPGMDTLIDLSPYSKMDTNLYFNIAKVTFEVKAQEIASNPALQTLFISCKGRSCLSARSPNGSSSFDFDIFPLKCTEEQAKDILNSFLQLQRLIMETYKPDPFELTDSEYQALSRLPVYQKKSTVEFLGYSFSEYAHPVLTNTNKYEASFSNSGEQINPGNIVLDIRDKTFTVNFFNGGDAWLCRFDNKQKNNKRDEFWGDIEETIYSGYWEGSNNECQLVITKKESGCIVEVRSQRVIDNVHGINDWKKVFVFGTKGECL